MSGEEARSRGIEAEEKAWGLIRALGYETCDLPNEDYDIDCIAEFNERQTLPNALKRPRYSPAGLTAFEVTSQRITVRKFTLFRQKINRYNEDHPNSTISGGILLTDKSISNAMCNRMKDQDIFGWGASRVVFYWQKVRTFGSWASFGTTREIIIDNLTSCIRCFSPNSEQLFRFAIFFDDHTQVLSPAKVRRIMDGIKEQTLSTLTTMGLIPIDVLFEYHALGGMRDLSEDLLAFISDWRNDNIIVFMPKKDAFNGYRTFPALLLK